MKEPFIWQQDRTVCEDEKETERKLGKENRRAGATSHLIMSEILCQYFYTKLHC